MRCATASTRIPSSPTRSSRTHEATGLPYASTVAGKMHACGHDRHTAILLAAARVLAEQEGFDAVVSGGRDDLTKRIEADVALHSKRAEFAKMRE